MAKKVVSELLPNQVMKRPRDTLKGRVVRTAISAKHVRESVGEITEGCEIIGLTMGFWSLYDLIEYCLEATGPADVVISTWTAAAADLGFAYGLMGHKRIRTLRFLVDSSFEIRQPAYTAAMRAYFGDAAIRVTENHAKFTTIRNEKWNLVLRGSMNLTENRRLEMFEISDSVIMLEWLHGLVNTIFEKQTKTFERSSHEHCLAFGEEWLDPQDSPAPAMDSRFFDPSPFGTDILRAGFTYGD